MSFLHDDLIERVKRISGVPSGIDDRDFRNYINQEMVNVTVPLIQTTDISYLSKYVDVAITSEGYRIPRRSIGATIHEVAKVEGGNYTKLCQVERTGHEGRLGGYYLERNKVFFVNVTGTVRIWYTDSPSKLVSTDRCALITSLSSSPVGINVSGVPANITASIDLDVVQGVPSFDVLAQNVQSTIIVGNSIRFAAQPSSEAAAGDYVCPAGEAPLLTIPEAAQDFALHGAALRLMRLQQLPGINEVKEEYLMLRQNLISLLGGRVKKDHAYLRVSDDFFVR